MARQLRPRPSGEGGGPLKHFLGASAHEGRLRLLHLVAAWGKLEVGGTFETALPADAEGEAAAAKELGAFVISGRIPPGAGVVLGVPRGDFLLRRITTPPVSLRSLPELVAFETERHLPGKREEFLCGWTPVGRGEDGGHRVAIGAARREALAPTLAVLRRANLAPTSVQPEPLALAAAVRAAEPSLRSALLLHLSPGTVGVDCLAGESLAFSRTFAIAGEAWRESLGPAGREDEAADRRQAAAAALAEQIAARVSEPVFRESLPGGALAEVRVLGPGAGRARLLQRLGELLAVPVRVSAPWPLVRWGSPPAELDPWAVPLALARLGATGGQGGIELAEERQEGLHRAPSLRTTVVLAAVLALLLLSWGGAALLRDRRQLGRVDAEILALKGRVAELEGLNRTVSAQRDLLAYLQETIDERPRQAALLRELTTLVPADAYLSEYAFKQSGVEISGFSSNASRLLPILEQSPLLAGVEFSAPIVAQGGGLERFRIRMKLEGGGG